MFITITGSEYYLGVNSYKIGQKLCLFKDKDNNYDDEAIKVKTENGVTCGYVANSIDTVARGTHSAGYVYNFIEDSKECKVRYIIKDSVIAEIIE